jgi:hypothetical protein
MGKCPAITADGAKCKNLAAKGSEWCSAHDPAHADRRRRAARKGGRSKGGGSEIADLKREVRAVIGGVLTGKIDKANGSVALQGYNVLLRAHELGQKADIDELAREVEELKNAHGRAS